MTKGAGGSVVLDAADLATIAVAGIDAFEILRRGRHCHDAGHAEYDDHELTECFLLKCFG